MRNSDLIDALPDAVCVVDSSGYVLQSNKQFQRKIFTGHYDATSSMLREIDALNFAQDILHVEHRRKFSKAVDMLLSKVFTVDESPSIALRLSKTLTNATSKSYPVFRLIHWTLSASSIENRFILVGRDPDVECVDVDVDSSGNPVLAIEAELPTHPIVRKKKPTWTENFFDSRENMSLDLIDFFENAPVALHWLSSTGHILWANKVELALMGYAPEDYFGHALSEFLMPGEEEFLMDIFTKASSGAIVHDAPLKLRAKNGETKYAILDTSVKFKTNGSFSHTRCFLRNDITRQLKEDALDSKIKVIRNHAESKATFIRNVFHEIRTPMHVLSSFFSDSDPSRDDFEDMKHHTDSIMGIVDDLTFSTAFEAGEVSQMYPVPIHVPSVLAQVVDAVNAVEQKPGGYVAIKLHCDRVPVDAEDMIADPYFRRVLFGLLSNAVKFSPLDGVVDVTVSFKGVNGSDHCTSHCSVEETTPPRSRTMTMSTTSMSTTSMSTPGESSDGYHSHHSPRSGLLSPSSIEIDEDASMYKGGPSCLAQSVTPGTFTFHFRNSTVKPMNVTEARRFFNNYYHNNCEPRCELTVDSPPASDRANRGFNNIVASPPGNFNDLKQYEGLGLGLYTAFNMVNLMGGTLECSADTEEACFWFTIPSNFMDLASPSMSPSAGRHTSSFNTVNMSDAMTIEKTRRKLEKERIRRKSAPDIASGKTSPKLFVSNPPVQSIPSFAILADLSKIGPKLQSPLNNCRRTMVSEFNEMRVLVVDDSRICQKVAARALSGLDFVFEFACNGQVAIDKLAEVPQRFDAVLMDLRMPVMDGLTAIRKCRGDLGLKKLPIVALTAEVGLSIKEEAMKAGASWFLNKPTRSQELICVLRALSFTK